tara:strand:- start:90 stop:467 length:378 start_codon:yes stop_codon:yes gene_type:complete
MKYLIFSVLVTLTFSLSAKEKIVYEVGNELTLKRDNSVVLFYFKHDAIELNLNREFIDSPYGLFIDARDLYRIKKGEKIRLVESFRDGKIFKVELLKEKPRRDHYFIEIESLRSYNLINTETTSG